MERYRRWKRYEGKARAKRRRVQAQAKEHSLLRDLMLCRNTLAEIENNIRRVIPDSGLVHPLVHRVREFGELRKRSLPAGLVDFGILDDGPTESLTVSVLNLLVFKVIVEENLEKANKLIRFIEVNQHGESRYVLTTAQLQTIGFDEALRVYVARDIADQLIKHREAGR